jgi:hypothetical protein
MKFFSIVTSSFLLAGPLHGATDRENALVTRYVTMMLHSFEEVDDEKRAKFRQEPMVLACIAFYYYRESDPEFAEKLRGLASSLLRQSGTTLEVEFPVFQRNFIAPKSEKDALTVLEFWGFGTEMARTVVADARADGMKDFKSWMEAASKKK